MELYSDDLLFNNDEYIDSINRAIDFADRLSQSLLLRKLMNEATAGGKMFDKDGSINPSVELAVDRVCNGAENVEVV